MDNKTLYNKVQLVLNAVHEDTRKRKIEEKEDRLNFACPYCGDSHDNPYAKRGNFYFKNYYYKCFNEECRASALKFFNDFNIDIDIEDKLSILDIKPRTVSIINIDILYEFIDKLVDVETFLEWSQTSTFKVKKLETNGLVWKYLKSRKITDLSNIYQGILNNQPIVVILNTINNKLISLQYRSISGKKIYKFYNFSQIYKVLMKLELEPAQRDTYDKISQYFKFFQVDFNQPVTIIESYFDSTFFKNSISAVGINTDISLFLNSNLDIRFVYDNDKWFNNKKPAAVLKSEKLIKDGHKVFLWKKFIESESLPYVKDINAAVMIKDTVIKKLDTYFSIDEFDIINL